MLKPNLNYFNQDCVGAERDSSLNKNILFSNQFSLFHSTKLTFYKAICFSAVTPQKRILYASLGRESTGLSILVARDERNSKAFRSTIYDFSNNRLNICVH